MMNIRYSNARKHDLCTSVFFRDLDNIFETSDIYLIYNPEDLSFILEYSDSSIQSFSPSVENSDSVPNFLIPEGYIAKK
jgi:hypothetical protein